MTEPEKPFACSIEACGMTFTNEDHLHVHTKKHDMVLQLGLEQKSAFVADQTPTPTRFIRNCEEVGLFQDLQNVNPFDEGFKRAMETKPGILSLDSAIATAASDDVLHTPQMVFPNLSDSSDSVLFSSNNGHKNVIISRSSSDETGVIRGYNESAIISKLRNDVTAKHAGREKTIATDEVVIVSHKELSQKDANVTALSHKSDVIKISSVEIIKNPDNTDAGKRVPILISCSDSVKSGDEIVSKDVMLIDSNKLTVPDTVTKAPVMSQKSLDYVVDSFTSEASQIVIDKDIHLIGMPKKNFQNDIHKKVDHDKPKTTDVEIIKTAPKRKLLEENKIKTKRKPIKEENYEVIIKLPDGKNVHLKSGEISNEDSQPEDDTKQKIKKNLINKSNKNNMKVVNHLPVITGFYQGQTKINNILTHNLAPAPTLVSIASLNGPVIYQQPTKVPIPLNPKGKFRLKPIGTSLNTNEIRKPSKVGNTKRIDNEKRVETTVMTNDELERRSAASKRYRQRQKQSWAQVIIENKRLIEENHILKSENMRLKEKILNHTKICTNCEDFRSYRGHKITVTTAPIEFDKSRQTNQNENILPH